MVRRPQRGYIQNLTTGEERQWYVNPTNFTEVIDAQWEDIEVVGMSHEPARFKNTKSLRFSLTFFVSRLSVKRAMIASDTEAQDAVKDFKAFIHSLAVPDGNFVSEGLVGAEPPRCIVCWPGAFTRVALLRAARIGFSLFDLDGSVRVLSAACEFSEFSQGRFWSEDVRRNAGISLGSAGLLTR